MSLWVSYSTFLKKSLIFLNIFNVSIQRPPLDTRDKHQILLFTRRGEFTQNGVKSRAIEKPSVSAGDHARREVKRIEARRESKLSRRENEAGESEAGDGGAAKRQTSNVSWLRERPEHVALRLIGPPRNRSERITNRPRSSESFSLPPASGPRILRLLDVDVSARLWRGALVDVLVAEAEHNPETMNRPEALS